MKIRNLAFFIIVIFSLTGFIFSSVFFHELSHYNDYKEIANNSEICLFPISNSSFQANLGYYKFSIDENNTEQYTQISKYTEIKAYSISIILAVILLMSFFVILKNI